MRSSGIGSSTDSIAGLIIAEKQNDRGRTKGVSDAFDFERKERNDGPASYCKSLMFLRVRMLLRLRKD